MNFFQWVTNYGRVVTRLSTLLKCQFVPGSATMETIIGRCVHDIIVCNNTQEFASRDQLTLRLAFLVKHLEEVSALNTPIFESLRTDLLRKDKHNHGTQFEIETAASLLRKGLKIEKGESPDFRIYFKDSLIGLECSSVQANTNSPKEGIDRIRTVLRKKQRLRYCNPKSALLLEASSLAQARQLPERNLIYELIATHEGQKHFGSILIFVIISAQNDIKSVYMRFDHPSIEASLCEFLDVTWPKGQFIPQYPVFWHAN